MSSVYEALLPVLVEMPRLHQALVTKLVGSEERVTAQELRLLTPAQRAAARAPASELAPEKSADVQLGAPVNRRAPHWYVLPWPAVVDLVQVTAVNAEGGTVVVQLRKGGFIRSPKRTDADQICAAIVDALTQLEGVRVTVYGRD